MVRRATCEYELASATSEGNNSDVVGPVVSLSPRANLEITVPAEDLAMRDERFFSDAVQFYQKLLRNNGHLLTLGTYHLPE